MNVEDQSSTWRGFSAPLGVNGNHCLYGPPPWSFEGFSASISLRVPDRDAQCLVPAPLHVAKDPIVRLTVFDFVCDCGHGERFVQRFPDLAQQSEAVVGIAVEHEGQPGYWPAMLWCTSDAEMAVGREMYGWAQRHGSVTLTRMPSRGWREGDFVTALVRRGDRPVFSFTIQLTRRPDAQPSPSDAATMDSHIGRVPIYTQTAIADPMRPGMVERRMVTPHIEDVETGPVWRGSVELDVFAPELLFLRSAEVLEGRWHRQSWTKQHASAVVFTDVAQA